MTEVLKIPVGAQEGFMKMQEMQQQMQQINYQKETLRFQKIEAERALEEMKEINNDTEVFKAVGPILIKSTKIELEKELKEKIETAEVRIRKVEKEEEQIKEELTTIQNELQKLLVPADDEKPQAAG
ncbi:MAG: prefoldin subunit beta [Nanoarchaeota archaeon]|nr:prefoldin subunit beta [Nanoarchaeota archaeon]